MQTHENITLLTYKLQRLKTFQYRRHLCPFISLFGIILVTLCLMVWDWRVLRAVPMIYCWPNLLFVSVSYYFLY